MRARGRNHEAANDAALSANVGARRAAGVQQGDAVSLQDVAGTIRAMLGMNRPPPDTRSQPKNMSMLGQTVNT